VLDAVAEANTSALETELFATAKSPAVTELPSSLVRLPGSANTTMRLFLLPIPRVLWDI